MASLPPHWAHAVFELGLNRGMRKDGKLEFFVKTPRTRKNSHLIVALRAGPLRKGNWAETSLMIDGPFVEGWVRNAFGVPKSVRIRGDVLFKQVSLSPSPIAHSEFHTRYPDVPLSLAHTFVLAHELGHAMSGWKEAAADRYAFRRMMLPQDPKAKKVRDAVYGKMLHPGSFMKWPT